MKIGRWAEPYTEPGNPFPDETDSFAAMPPESPMHILDYGLLSEMILPLIKVKRQGEERTEEGVPSQEDTKCESEECVSEEIYRLSKLEPWK